MIFARQPTLRYLLPMGEHWQMNFGVQQPSSEVDTFGTNNIPTTGATLVLNGANVTAGLVASGTAGQGVIACATEQQIVAAFAEEGVVTAFAEKLVRPGAASDRVVTGPAEQIGRRQCAVGFIERDGVVAGLAEHLDQVGVGDRGCSALNRYRSAIDENGSGRVALDGDSIVELIAEHFKLAGGFEKSCRNSHCVDPLERCARC